VSDKKYANASTRRSGIRPPRGEGIGGNLFPGSEASEELWLQSLVAPLWLGNPRSVCNSDLSATLRFFFYSSNSFIMTVLELRR
jgi:hypothetical protein